MKTGYAVALGFALAFLFGFTPGVAPGRHPTTPATTNGDYVYVNDGTVGGAASGGISNVTPKSVTCDGTTALAYDAVTAHAFSCLQVDNTNADAGSPFGSVDVISGYNALGTAGVDKVIQVTYYPIARALAVGTTTELAGVGAGNYTVELFDNTASSSLCATGNIVCSTAAGTTTTVDCKAGGTYPQTSAVKHDLLLRMNCSACATCPSGNVFAEMQTVPGN